jgi:hypothetical protein
VNTQYNSTIRSSAKDVIKKREMRLYDIGMYCMSDVHTLTIRRRSDERHLSGLFMDEEGIMATYGVWAYGCSDSEYINSCSDTLWTKDTEHIYSWLPMYRHS